jgi:predicted DNA-binding transcriptional regulator YafY
MIPEKLVEIDYSDHLGRRTKRRFIPTRLFFGTTEWHPEEQWLVAVWDIERQFERSIAMPDIHTWSPAPK